MEKSLYWYIGSPHILTNTCTTALTAKPVARKLLLRPCLIEHKDDLYKENAKTKQVLKENEYQQSINRKTFKRIANNHSLPHSQKQTQARNIQEEEIRMSINLS